MRRFPLRQSITRWSTFGDPSTMPILSCIDQLLVVVNVKAQGLADLVHWRNVLLERDHRDFGQEEGVKGEVVRGEEVERDIHTQKSRLQRAKATNKCNERKLLSLILSSNRISHSLIYSKLYG